MFTKDTVIILGAGASADLGYPIGIELVQDIIKNLRPAQSFMPEYKLLRRLEDFQPLSIDFFLSLHKEYADLGKEKISEHILKYQRQSFSRRGFDSCWYRYLLTEILRGTENNKQENILNNKLTIITFNYDISLEYFLYSRLQNMKYFENHKKEMDQFLETNLEIIHVYGQVFSKEEMLEDSRYIYEKASNFNSKTIAKDLKVIGEDRVGLEKSIQEKIISAKKVFILGYGFDEMNNSILGLSNIFRSRLNPPCFDLEKEVFITNYKNSEMINRKILGQILNQHNPINLHNLFKHNIRLSNVRNLIISNKTVNEAIGNDFAFG